MQRLIHKRKLKSFPLMIAIFLALSIPLGVYGLISLNNFDPSSNAGNTDQAVNSCFINFPYVNPGSVEVDKKVQVQISAYVPGEKIKNINIIDNAGNPVFQKQYTQATDRVIDIFIFSPKTIGAYNFMGTVTTDTVSRPCVVQTTNGVNVVATNTTPLFKTLPNSAVPSNAIKVGDNYEYTLKVTDSESDTINYSFSFTPNTSWLKYTVLDDGGKGKLTIKFTGKPDKPASYLANIFVHDGYVNHLSSQAWVISVDQDKNDVPKVTVYEPTTQSVKLGETVKISWNVQDLNQITKFDLYYATNPGNSSTWTPIAKGLSVKFGHYLFDTSKLALGKYTFIVQATDNYTPPAVGTGVSQEITITNTDGNNNNNGPDDGPQLVDPQIINISPSNNSQIKNKRASISATLIAGSKATIKKDSIKLVFDDKEITSKANVNQISEAEYTIVYTPEEDYKIGAHKVSIAFEDSKGSKGNKEWTFELVAETTDNDNVNIWGWVIPKRTLYIVAGGIGLLILALLIPWLLYLAWRGSRDQEEYDYTNIYNQTKPIEPDNTGRMEQYSTITPRPIVPVSTSQTFESTERVETVEPEIIQPEVTEIERSNTYAKLDNYSYPQPPEETTTEITETNVTTSPDFSVTNTQMEETKETVVEEPLSAIALTPTEETTTELSKAEEIIDEDQSNMPTEKSEEATLIALEPTAIQPVESSEPVQIFNTVNPLPTPLYDQPKEITEVEEKKEEINTSNNPPIKETQPTPSVINNINVTLQQPQKIEETQTPIAPITPIVSSEITQPIVDAVIVPNKTETPQEKQIDITIQHTNDDKTPNPRLEINNNIENIDNTTTRQSTSKITEDSSGDLPPIISSIGDDEEVTPLPDLDGDESYQELLRLAEQLDQQDKEEEENNNKNANTSGIGENMITAPSPLPDDRAPVNGSSNANTTDPAKNNNQQTPQ